MSHGTAGVGPAVGGGAGYEERHERRERSEQQRLGGLIGVVAVAIISFLFLYIWHVPRWYDTADTKNMTPWAMGRVGVDFNRSKLPRFFAVGAESWTCLVWWVGALGCGQGACRALCGGLTLVPRL